MPTNLQPTDRIYLTWKEEKYVDIQVAKVTKKESVIHCYFCRTALFVLSAAATKKLHEMNDHAEFNFIGPEPAAWIRDDDMGFAGLRYYPRTNDGHPELLTAGEIVERHRCGDSNG